MKIERKKFARITGVLSVIAILSVLVLFNSRNKMYLTEVKEVAAEKEDKIVDVEDENSLSTLLSALPKDIINDKKEQDRIKAIEVAKAAARKKAEEEKKKKIVYDGLTMDQLSHKLDKSLKSTLKGQGRTFAKYSVQLGIDPYMAVAIVLHETGCSWNCSKLVRTCYNVGGMKGSPGCGGGSYQRFSNLDQGIKAFMYNLYNNYYKYGLKTPEQINPKYASSKTWATKIRQYMRQIKNR